jgi:O-antigen/teichoic acid export membrane protein
VPRFTFTALIINVIACYVFIPLWSIEGAAIAAIAAQLIPLLWFGFTNMNVRNQLMCVVKFSSI